jgi:hypothetical protein
VWPERTAWENRYGYKVGIANPCPVQVITGRHRRGRSCCTGPRPAAFDHIFAISRGDYRGVVTQPYGLTIDAAVELVLWCHDHAATFAVLGDGFHNEATVAVVIFPEACPE